MKGTENRDWDEEDAWEMMSDDKDEAIKAVGTLKAALKNLVESQHQLVDAYVEKVEQLEAEVESWKNSYERANKENGEIASKLEAIYEAQRLDEELG